jgi:putative hydrolase of the HAD superfamily
MPSDRAFSPFGGTNPLREGKGAKESSRMTNDRERIEVIFFDAAGTLIETRGSVGEIYQQFAERYGGRSDSRRLQESFKRAFAEAAPLTFPLGTSGEEVRVGERAWWHRLVARVFDEEPPLDDFEGFFEEVFAAFAGASCWRLLEGAERVLSGLRRRGFRLGIISNFDTRLYPLLEALGIRDHFETIHLSSLSAAAKPSPQIFAAALAAHGLPAEVGCHVGDHPREDLLGALGAGMRAILLDPNGQFSHNPAANPPKSVHVRTLREILELSFLRGKGRPG